MGNEQSKGPGSLTIPAVVLTILAFFGLAQRPGKEAKSPAPSSASGSEATRPESGRASGGFSLSRMLAEAGDVGKGQADARMLAQLEVLQRHYFPKIAGDPLLVARLVEKPKPEDPSKGLTGTELLTWLLRGGPDPGTPGDAIECLVALVPDPVRSGSPYRYDVALQSLTLGLRSAGYLLELHDVDHLRTPRVEPNSGKAATESSAGETLANTGTDPDTRPPGVLLLRRTGTTGARDELLLVLLVTETPVRGVNASMLHSAFAISESCIQAQNAREPIRVIGPCFTGSAPSVIRAVRNWQEPGKGRPIPQVWINGSASAIKIEELQRAIRQGRDPKAFTIWCVLDSTADANAALFTFVDNHLRSLTDRGSLPVAFLAEESTGFGNNVSLPYSDSNADGSVPRFTIVNYSFPLHISEVRRRYSQQSASRGDGTSLKLGDQEVALKKEEQLGFADEGSTTPELPPIEAPGMMAAYDEIRLRETADDINRRAIRFVWLSATDVRDTIFVLGYLREHCPDAQLLTLTNDIALSHHDNSSRLRGTIVATSYPLWTSWEATELGRQSVFGALPLPDNSSHGLYNAVLAHRIDREAAHGGTRQASELAARLIHYDPRRADPVRIAIAIVGQRGFHDLAWPRLGSRQPPGSYASFKWRLPDQRTPAFSSDADGDAPRHERFFSWTSGVTPTIPLTCVALACLALAWHLTRAWRAIQETQRPTWLRAILTSPTEATGAAVRTASERFAQLPNTLALWFDFRSDRETRNPRGTLACFILAGIVGLELGLSLTGVPLLRSLGVNLALGLVLLALWLVDRGWRTVASRSRRSTKPPGGPEHHAPAANGRARLLTWLVVVGYGLFQVGLRWGQGPVPRGVVSLFSWLVSPSVLSLGVLSVGVAGLGWVKGATPWFVSLARALGLGVTGFLLLRVAAIEPDRALRLALQCGLLGLFLTLIHQATSVIGLWHEFQQLTTALLGLPVGNLFDRLPRRLTPPFASPFQALRGDSDRELDDRLSDSQSWLRAGAADHGIAAPEGIAAAVAAEWSSRDPKLAYDADPKDPTARPNSSDVSEANRNRAGLVLAAEEYFALECVRTLNRVLDVLWNKLALITVLGLLLMAAVNSYPFTPGGQLFRWMMIVVVLVVAVIVYVVAGIHRNELIARVNKQSPDRSLLNLDFLTKMMTYAVPLVALLAAFSYGFGDMIAVLLGPFLKG